MSFIYDDFLKSGISSEIIEEYANRDFLEEDENSWTLYYPKLTKNEKSTYWNKRMKNSLPSKYLKPQGETSRIFRPLALSLQSLESDYLIITEGEKKAIKAVQEGFNCIALAGVWAWKMKTDEKDEDILSADIIPDIVSLDLKGKTVYLCYDNDMWSKEQVKNALYHFALYLTYEKHAIVKIISLPQEEEKLGLDDYLIKYGKENFQILLNSAKTVSVKDIQRCLMGRKNKPNNFPLEIFPSEIQRTISDLAANLDAPVEYLASSFLLGASAIMNGRYAVMVNRFQNWIDYPILWIALIGSPSQKKSPCLKVIKKLLDKYEQVLADDFERKNEAYQRDIENYKIDMKKYEKSRLSNNPNINIKMPIKPSQPFKQRLTTQNATVEALSTATYYNEQDSRRGVCVWVDELAFLFKGLGQYKKGGNDEEYFLQAWSRQITNIIRQDRDYTTTISHNIIGSIQPAVLDKTLFVNGIDSYNGMIERWLFVCCDFEETGKTARNDIDKNTLEGVYDRLFRLNEEEKIYEFSPAAQQLFDEYCHTICVRKKQNSINDLAKNYLQKQTNYVARFALILHCIENPEDAVIKAEIIEKAIRLSTFYIQCFEKITTERQCKTPLTTETLNYLYAKKLDAISPSKLYKSNTSKYKTIANAEIVLENLANEGRGRMQKSKNGGKKFILYK